MPWNDVPWTNGDYITEQKLDYMTANDAILRAELDGRLVACAVQGELSLYTTAPTGTRTVKLYVDSSLIYTSAAVGSGWAAWTGATNLSISSITDGLRSLSLALDWAGTEIGRMTWRFQKTEELLYLSAFGEARQYQELKDYQTGDPGYFRSYNGILVKNVTILGHRTVKSW